MNQETSLEQDVKKKLTEYKITIEIVGKHMFYSYIFCNYFIY